MVPSFLEQLPGSWKAGQTPTRSSPYAPPAFPGSWSRELTAQRMRQRSVVPAHGSTTQLCYLSFWGSGMEPRPAGASASRSREAAPGCQWGLWPVHRLRLEGPGTLNVGRIRFLTSYWGSVILFCILLEGSLRSWPHGPLQSAPPRGGQGPVTLICNGSLSLCAVRFHLTWGPLQGACPVGAPGGHTPAPLCALPTVPQAWVSRDGHTVSGVTTVCFSLVLETVAWAVVP